MFMTRYGLAYEDYMVTLVINVKQAEILVRMAHAGFSNISIRCTLSIAELLSYSFYQIATLLIKADFAMVFMMLVAMVTNQ